MKIKKNSLFYIFIYVFISAAQSYPYDINVIYLGGFWALMEIVLTAASSWIVF